MIRKRALILTTLALAITLAVPASAQWDHLKDFLYVAPDDNNKYLAESMQTIVVAADTEDAVNVCAAVGDDVNGSDGSVHVLFEFMRYDDDADEFKIEKKRKSGPVDGNRFLKCQETFGFKKGDIISAYYRFSGFPRIRSKTGVGAINIVTSLGKDRLFPGTVYGPPAAGGQVELQQRHLKDSFYVAPDGNNKYLKKFTHTIVVAADTGSKVNLCSAVGDDVNESDAKVHVLFEMTRFDDGESAINVGEAIAASSTEKKRKSGRIEDNVFLKCLETGGFRTGDIITAHYSFSGAPRIRSEFGIGAINIVTSLAEDRLTKKELYGPPPPPPPPAPTPAPTPNPTPNPNPTPTPTPTPTPSPGGGLSSADFTAAAKLLKANSPVQLWRAKDAWGRGKWWVIGPGTIIDRTQVGNVNPKTVGFGNSISAAVANYESKRGKLKSGGTLSSADRAGLIWYNKINSSGGPTSVRRARSGGYYGEYFRPGRGANHQGPFSTPGQALDWLRKQGL
jgi:hypothetical protein